MTTHFMNLDHKNGFHHEFLHCDEVLMDDPMTNNPFYNPFYHGSASAYDVDTISPVVTQHDFEQLFASYMEKETKSAIGSGYLKFLQENPVVSVYRLKAIRYFLHCKRRFDISLGTVFKALNYVDRFLDMNKCCNVWSYRMFEVLFLASFSIAVKFCETYPPLHLIQEGLEHHFEAELIKTWEFKILKSLRWEVNSITPYSYVEIVESKFTNNFKFFLPSTLDKIFISSLDEAFLEYKPCVIALSGFICILELDIDIVTHIASFLPKDQQEKVQACYEKLQEILGNREPKSKPNANPSSPDTVLELQVATHEEHVDQSAIEEPAKKEELKRKRVDGDDKKGGDSVNKYKKQNV